MSVDLNLSSTPVTQTTAANTAAQTKSTDTDKAAESTATSAASTGFSEAAVYEKSDDAAASTAATDNATKNVKQDRSAIIAQLQADQEARQNQLMDIVRKTMQGQGKTLAQADDAWKFLASGDFTVDAATKAQAQADIADDGYWGVNQTSDRILDFAKALAGDDPSKADKFLDAFKKGFEQATKSWGKDLPDISQRTYDAVVKKFDDWKNSADSATVKEDAAETAATAATQTEA